MQRLLITDDDMHLRKLVKNYADMEGYACEQAESGQKALELLRQKEYDLVLLDVMMPGIDGFETLQELRRFTQVPVIMLTARKEEYDHLMGFELGADDYVPKPFRPRELMARVRAVLKRSAGPQDETMHFGRLHISKGAHRAEIDGKPLTLTRKEFDLLVALAENRHIVLTREQLLKNVWGYDYMGDVRTVDTHVRTLRERLGDCKSAVQTVWGVGYRFEYKDL